MTLNIVCRSKAYQRSGLIIRLKNLPLLINSTYLLMQIYLAPLQGLTDRIFREAFSKNIGLFDKTFSPFIRVQNENFYRPTQCNDILATHNLFQQPVPQFLGNDAASFQKFEELCTENGYNEVNINMGCPYPMVTGKKMGAGLLAHPDLISKLLEGVFSQTKLRVSVKCRLGMENTNDFPEIIAILNQFPLEEVIIHPRIGKQQYKGEADMKAFAQFLPLVKHSVCYNGDILTPEDVNRLVQLSPQTDKIMIGRGLLRNPFLLSEIRGEKLTREEKVKKLRNFHLSMIENCGKKYSGDQHFLRHMVELWEYQSLAFEDGHKIFKAVKKCKTQSQYGEIIFAAINNYQ